MVSQICIERRTRSVAFQPTALRSRRAFTLVELLVAIVAGMTVTMGAFAFAKASTRSFQQETRIANAMMSNTLGFRRLVSDLQRASFLSTPNIQRDYQPGTGAPGTVCVQPSAALFPIGITSLSGLWIQQGGTYASTGQSSPVDALNNLTPDQVTIAGSFTSAEQFPVRTILSGNGASTQVILEPRSGAVARTQNTLNQAGVANADWTTIFMPNSILRVVDLAGYQHFGVIQSAQANAQGQPVITLKQTPALYRQGNAPPPSNPSCTGIGANAVGTMANVINRVRYQIRDLRQVPAYATLYSVAASAPEDQNRRELVRYQLDANDTIIAGTIELIAEYAIDLKFGVTVAQTVSNVNRPDPQLIHFEPGEAGVYDWGRSVLVNPTQPGAERIRAIHIRLGIRSREADRSVGLAGPQLAGNVPGGLFRYQFPNTVNTSSGYRFARVRTLQAEVGLPNQIGVFW